MNDAEQLEPPSPQISNKPFPNFWQATGLLAVYFVLTFGLGVGSVFVFILAEAMFSITIDDDKIEHYMMMSIVFLSLIFLSLVTILGYFLSKSPIQKVFPVRTLSLKEFLAVVVFTLGFGILLSELNNILTWLNPSFFEYDDNIIIENAYLSIFLTVLITPIVEELFFRGLLLHGFVPRYGTFWAIVISSILFGIVHIDPTVVIYTFIGGLALG